MEDGQRYVELNKNWWGLKCCDMGILLLFGRVGGGRGRGSISTLQSCCGLKVSIGAWFDESGR